MVAAMAVVRTEIIGGVGILVLNNPDERNTLTAAMVDGIVGALDRFESDGGVGAVVVTGAGPAFCAGANLGNLAESTPASLMSIYEGFMRVSRCPLPTVAAVNGPAVGAGMNLAPCGRRASRRSRARGSCPLPRPGRSPRRPSAGGSATPA
jgi:enoyl-CoA hydratase